MNNTIHITGSTIGAMAVGPGAQASNTTATDRVGGKFSLDIKARFASRAQIWSWLRTAGERVDKGTGLEDHFAETVGPSSFSMSLDSETPGAVAHVDNDVLLAEISFSGRSNATPDALDRLRHAAAAVCNSEGIPLDDDMVEVRADRLSELRKELDNGGAVEAEKTR